MGNALDTCCLPQSVRVVTTDGRVVGYSGEVIKVRDVLQTYPHHYLTEAGQETPMLDNDDVLKPSHTYVLQPLPRLFNVGHCHSPVDIHPCASYSCCLCIAAGGFNTSELSDNSNDDPEALPEGPGVGWSSPTAKTCVGKTATEQMNGPSPKISRLPSALPIGLQELLKSAEIEWKEITDLNKSWRPDLESIREGEEPMKTPTMSPMLRSPIRPKTSGRPTLATLMKEDAKQDADELVQQGVIFPRVAANLAAENEQGIV